VWRIICKKNICRSTIGGLHAGRAQPEDYHRRIPSRRELHEIFRLESTRSISNGFVVRQDIR
jgi:hypothetical protein